MIDKLFEECIESIDEVQITEITQTENRCSSCTLYIVLLLIFFTLCIRIATYFAYYKYMSLHKENFPNVTPTIKQKVINILIDRRS